MESNKADIIWLSWLCRLTLDQMHAHLAEKSLASLGNFVGAFGKKGPCSTYGQQGTPSKVLFGERPQCCELPAEPEVLMMLIVRPRLTHHGSSVISLCGADVEWTSIRITDSSNEAAAFVVATPHATTALTWNRVALQLLSRRSENKRADSIKSSR